MRRYISENELKQEIMQQEREMMRRVKLRDSMRVAMASNSVLAVSTQISTLIETAMKDSCAIMKLVGDKALDLQDRQVSCDCADAVGPGRCMHSSQISQDDLFRNVDRVLDAFKQGGKGNLAAAQPPISASAAKLAKVAGEPIQHERN